MKRALQLTSVGGTLAVLAFVPGNDLKLVSLVALWALTFAPRLSRREVASFALLCALFTGLNARALQNGIFAFTAPELLGMPSWELLMWGYYLTWSRRVVGGAPPRARLRTLLPFAALYALPFSLPLGDVALFALSGALLAFGFALFHHRRDVTIAAVMTGLGAAVEYTGVGCGLWFYRAPWPGGVPPWFITLWGGVGLLAGRLLPIIEDQLMSSLEHRSPQEVQR